jgi:uncharacterized protein (UPF0548 family)
MAAKNSANCHFLGAFMFLLRKPSEPTIRAFLDGQSKLAFTYAAVGASASEPPSGYDVDKTRVRLGSGRHLFALAQAALRRWAHFDLGWVELHWPSAAIEPGQVVGLLAHIFGLWSLNACRIVYVSQEERRFGFAYGTLPEHAESGEERFTVEWNQDDSIWYDILAFSRPNQFLPRIGYPFVRRLQRRFAKDSAAALVKAVDRDVRRSASGR